ncbi:epoxyqueuosine reductase QueH [Phyllobacterium sp. P30BS-XVII]|uniref:epoxyqueuosine reductase QueH n=1 Tax=Phyllobacterium sp. P30BS-XVII TaxID=2587046 RepID=UPI0017E156DE|nr:epoxyqueuosine reductase QueH [Phyllobacterium sp. P30BS-XVII]MBA8903920.1 putative adenine nucleotide alpha hydrolase (AANH) superfamily ATPase [Phyllobacterium sp. P30BS-XVII]
MQNCKFFDASRIGYTIFVYNSDIHPECEYLLRKDENARLANKRGIEFFGADKDKALFDRN